MAPTAWKALIRVAFAGALLLAASASLAQSGPIPARPDLRLLRAEIYSGGGGQTFVRWNFDVANKAAYPAEMFTPARDLPPCGSNTNSARTWVDFFDSNDNRIYGFCALTGSDQLGRIWFATPLEQPAPSGVYVVFNDRRTNRLYRSEVVDLRPEALVAQAAVLRSAGDGPGAFRLLERAIVEQKRTGPVNPAWYDEAMTIASVLVDGGRLLPRTPREATVAPQPAALPATRTVSDQPQDAAWRFVHDAGSTWAGFARLAPPRVSGIQQRDVLWVYGPSTGLDHGISHWSINCAGTRLKREGGSYVRADGSRDLWATDAEWMTVSNDNTLERAVVVATCADSYVPHSQTFATQEQAIQAYREGRLEPLAADTAAARQLGLALAPAQAPVATTASVNSCLERTKVTFTGGESALDRDDLAAIRLHVQRWSAHPAASAMLFAIVSYRGGAGGSPELRAGAVQAALLREGVPADQIEIYAASTPYQGDDVNGVVIGTCETGW